MIYRINTYNEDYIMINRYETFLLQTIIMDKEKHSITDVKAEYKINKLINCMLHYRNKKGSYITIKEVAIDKNSELGNYIVSLEKQKRTDISMKEIINALLACIEKEEWEYYETLTKIIKQFKEQNCSKHDYISFKLTMGSEITNYITTNSRRIPTVYNNHSDKTVYLYENDIIVSTELPKQTKTNSKTKLKTK